MYFRLIPRAKVLWAAAWCIGVALYRPVQAQNRIAVLGALPPLTDDRAANAARAALAKAGYQVSVVAGDELADPRTLKPDRYDLLVLPHCEVFPAAAQSNLLAYLKAHGRLLCLGAPPFTRYVYQSDGQWQTWDQVLAHLQSTGPILDIGRAAPAAWTRASSDKSNPATVRVEAGPHGPALHLDFTKFTDWDNFAPPPFAASPFPAGSDLMAFWAKGDANTDAIVIEWKERDRSRWITTVGLTPQWKRYVVAPRDFRYWKDNPSKGRGGTGDHFRPENGWQLSLGLAQSHAMMPQGAKNIWISDLAAAQMPPHMPNVEPPVLESLSPWYKLQNSVAGQWRPIARYRGVTGEPAPGRLQELTTGAGPDLWLYRPLVGPYAGAVWGAAPAGQIVVSQVAGMLRPWYVASAGPDHASYQQGEPVQFEVNLRWPSGSSGAPVHLSCSLQVYRAAPRPITNERVHAASVATVDLAVGAASAVPLQWTSPLAPGNYGWSIRVNDSRGQAVDTISDQFTVLPATPQRVPFVTVQGGEFMLEGKPWRPMAINFYPLWVSGQDRDEYWSSWLSPNQYDPELVEQNVSDVQALGIDLVSLQYNNVNQAPALNDFLARCFNHGIRVNVYVSGGHPLSLDPEKVKSLIRTARLADNPAVFAYDVAWEPHAGHYAERKRLDPEWQQWVLDNYGSAEKAERDWGVAAPRAAGQLTSPPDEQFTQDGAWRKLVAAYRRFLDDRVSHGYRTTREAVRAVDTNHLIGARSGYGGNGGLFAEGSLAFDLRSGAQYLDFISPEGYAVNGDWNGFLGGGGLTTAYARWAGNGKPVFWAEFGRSVYPATTAEKIKNQGDYYDSFYRMVLQSGANGAAGWWWPGGLRLDENSDYGVINPDGQPRPAALVTRQYAPRLQAMTLPLSGQRVEITVDRDADARGYAGIWLANRDKYAALRSKGVVPVIKTPGTGTTTADMPLLAVGDVPADGFNPLKYANADLNVTATRVSATELRLTVLAVNSGEATWLPAGKGRVVASLQYEGSGPKAVPLPAAVPRFGEVRLPPVSVRVAAGVPVTVRLALAGPSIRALAFGEKVVVNGKAGP